MKPDPMQQWDWVYEQQQSVWDTKWKTEIVDSINFSVQHLVLIVSSYCVDCFDNRNKPYRYFPSKSFFCL